MQNSSRTSKSLRNIIVTLICQLAMTLVGLVARKVFLMVLDTEYLGLSSLFSSVLTMLSLAELGIGPAMIFSLYKPLAEQNTETCRSLMRIYKKAYRIIGSVVLGLGLLVSPFLTALVKEVPEQIDHLHVIFLLFVVDTAVSYFYSYKRSLIIASQMYYKIDSVHTLAYVGRNVVQAAVLFLTGNYYLFLGVQIVSTFAENLILSRWADRRFPWLNNKEKTGELPGELRAEVVRNVKAMVFHRVGGIVIDATDNVLISRFFGLLFLGLYANYLLIINAVKGFISAAFSAVSASVGDFGAQEDADHSYGLFRRMFFLNFWVSAFSSTCLFVLLPPFISLLYGSDKVIGGGIFAVVALNFYIECMRKTVLTFKESYGLPWYDRYKPLVSALVNVAFSVVFALQFGEVGVFLGTIVAQLGVNVWVEARVVFSHAFSRKLSDFFRQYLLYGAVALAVAGLTYGISLLLPVYTLPGFLLAVPLCLVLPNGVLLLLFHRREEFRYLVSVFRGYLPKRK